MSSIFKKMNAQKIKSLCLFSFFISGDSWKTKTISNQKPLVYILSPQRCLSSARAHAEISRCTFQHDTAFDKVCNTTLKRALALFSNLSFSYDLDEIWIYRFLKTRTRTHAHMHKHTVSSHSTWMQLKNWSLHRETGTFGRCSVFRATWLCHLDDLLCQSPAKLTADLVWNPEPQVYRRTQHNRVKVVGKITLFSPCDHCALNFLTGNILIPLPLRAHQTKCPYPTRLL